MRKGITMGITGIRISSISSIPKTSMSKTSITISSVQECRISFSISISITLGNMDNTGRVSNITSSTSISTSYGRDSSGSKPSNVGAGRWTVRGITSNSMRKGITMGITGITKTSITGITSIT